MKTIKYTNYNIHNEPQSVQVDGKLYNRVPYAKEYSAYITIKGKSYVISAE
jgi:hypothetical protein